MSIDQEIKLIENPSVINNYLNSQNNKKNKKELELGCSNFVFFSYI